MIVEEKSAGSYWCPFVRQLATATEGGKLPGKAEITAMAGINRGMGSSSGEPAFMGSCIGKACMAWRWHREKSWEGSLATGISVPKEEISETHGYCGLAGGAR